MLGALIGKGAASVVDSRDPGCHLDDAAVLLASIESVRELELSHLSTNDRRGLPVIARVLAGVTHPAWLCGDVERKSTKKDCFPSHCGSTPSKSLTAAPIDFTFGRLTMHRF